MKERLFQLAAKAIQPIKGDLIGIGGLLAVMWAVFFLDGIFPLDRLALVPRRLSGLPGIVAIPFLHQDLNHILGNTFPLFVLLALLAGSQANTWKIVISIVLGSGVLLWIAGFDAAYKGASMLVFGLIGFLVPSGFLEKRPVPMVISMIVGVMYGWTFLMGLLPLSSDTSELAHFYGAITGVALAFLVTKTGLLEPRNFAPRPEEVAKENPIRR